MLKSIFKSTVERTSVKTQQQTVFLHQSKSIPCACYIPG